MSNEKEDVEKLLLGACIDAFEEHKHPEMRQYASYAGTPPNNRDMADRVLAYLRRRYGWDEPKGRDIPFIDEGGS